MNIEHQVTSLEDSIKIKKLFGSINLAPPFHNAFYWAIPKSDAAIDRYSVVAFSNVAFGCTVDNKEKYAAYLFSELVDMLFEYSKVTLIRNNEVPRFTLIGCKAEEEKKSEGNDLLTVAGAFLINMLENFLKERGQLPQVNAIEETINV